MTKWYEVTNRKKKYQSNLVDFIVEFIFKRNKIQDLSWENSLYVHNVQSQSSFGDMYLCIIYSQK